MNLVLFALRDNLLTASQSVILLSSAFKECSASGILLMSQKRVVSSAYMIILNMSVHNGKSLIYTENRKGPNTDNDNDNDNDKVFILHNHKIRDQVFPDYNKRAT